MIVIGLYMVLWGKRKDEKEAGMIEQHHNTSTKDTLTKASTVEKQDNVV